MDFTTDKLRSLVKKWQTLIETIVDVKTTDSYTVRVFVIAFTKRRNNQVKKTSYAQHAQIRNIRKKMVEIINKEVGTVDLKEFVQKLIPEGISSEIEKACRGIYPLQNVHIRKVKVLRKPKLDVGKLLELHGDVTSSAPSEDTGAKVERAKDFVEPAVLSSV